MPTLICDLRPGAHDLVEPYRDLRAVGEGVVLYWPRAAATSELASATDAASLEAALDDERLVRIESVGPTVPAWLPWTEFTRILLIRESSSAFAAEQELLLAQLFAAGAEAVELIAPEEARDLPQSWHSGRRAQTTMLVTPGPR